MWERFDAATAALAAALAGASPGSTRLGRLLGIAARCLADAQRRGYRREDIARRLGARPSIDPDESERVEQLIDAARAPQVERALRRRLTDIEREMRLLVAFDGLTPAAPAPAPARLPRPSQRRRPTVCRVSP